VLDVNASPSGPFAAVQTGFIESQAQLLAYYPEPAAGGGLSPAAAELQVMRDITQPCCRFVRSLRVLSSASSWGVEAS